MIKKNEKEDKIPEEMGLQHDAHGVSIEEAAKNFKTAKMSIISDVVSVPVNTFIYREDVAERNGQEAYSFYYAIIGGTSYRVPKSVLFQLREILEAGTQFSNFHVQKTGEGLKTQYTVIPL